MLICHIKQCKSFIGITRNKNLIAVIVIACNCNSLSSRCFFDEELYQRTGHGGHCLDCRENTAGPHCERCKEGYFRQSEEDRCEPCQCNIVGKYLYMKKCRLYVGFLTSNGCAARFKEADSKRTTV